MAAYGELLGCNCLAVQTRNYPIPQHNSELPCYQNLASTNSTEKQLVIIRRHNNNVDGTSYGVPKFIKIVIYKKYVRLPIYYYHKGLRLGPQRVKA